MNKKEVRENILLVDADALDETIGQLRAFMSQRLGRELPAADLASWIVCCAMDAGWDKSGDKGVNSRVVFVRSAEKTQMQHLQPGDLTTELDGKAFTDPYMGEFLLSVVTEEGNQGQQPLYVQCVETLLADAAKHQLLLVPDVARCAAGLQQAVKGNEARVKVMGMRLDAWPGMDVMQLGFGLLHAMNVSPDDVEK